MVITLENMDRLAWEKMDNLLPVMVQNHATGKALMLGYMNQEALKTTLNSDKVTFYSRSKQGLWTKGETSQHFLYWKEISTDCDQDAILILADPHGPTCHKGVESCWDHSVHPQLTFLSDLERLIAERKNESPESSYTASLFQKGIKRIAQKVGEEGVETALAATVQDKEELVNESADLLYHLLVLLQASDLTLDDVIAQLQSRHNA